MQSHFPESGQLSAAEALTPQYAGLVAELYIFMGYLAAVYLHFTIKIRTRVMAKFLEELESATD